MHIFIYDKAASVLSAGLSYVINANFPDATVIRSSEVAVGQARPDKVDLLVLFQQPDAPVSIKEWQAVKEFCANPPCFGLLEAPSFKSLKSLLCSFPMKLLAYSNEVNDELIKKVIANLNSGGILFSKNITSLLHEYLCKCDDDDEANVHLTRREGQVLELVRKGKSAPQIAEDMQLSVNTVQVFLSKLRKKFKVRNTLSLVNKK